jgi:hypothetical protein
LGLLVVLSNHLSKHIVIVIARTSKYGRNITSIVTKSCIKGISEYHLKVFNISRSKGIDIYISQRSLEVIRVHTRVIMGVHGPVVNY